MLGSYRNTPQPQVQYFGVQSGQLQHVHLKDQIRVN
jgi:hypothetical protein